MRGDVRIAAPPQIVWEALNDPEFLKDLIPGCQSMERLSETETLATVKVKFGFFSATFAGKILLSNIHAPDSYTISAEGQGGLAGFARGSADVMMIPEGDETLLTYDAKADVEGKLAQMGGKLIDVTVGKLAQRFFDDFNAAVSERAGA